MCGAYLYISVWVHVYAGACPQVCTSMWRPEDSYMCSSGAVNHFCVSQDLSLLNRLGWLDNEPRDLSDAFSHQGVGK